MWKKMKPLLIVAIIILLTTLVISNTMAETSKEDIVDESKHITNNLGVDTHGITITMLEEKIDKQEELEQSYLKKLEKGAYTEDNMLVVQDPYGNSPLTALVLFETEEPAKITVKVPGATDDTAITNTFNDDKTTHAIPVLGLLSDTTNGVQITVETESGDRSEQTLHITTEALPDYIGTTNVEKANTEEMELDDSTLTFYVPSTKYAFAFDTNGDVRWYNSRYNSHVFKELENGHILYLTKEDNDGSTYNQLVEMDYLGKYYEVYQLNADVTISEGGSLESTMVHHDAIELPNNNLLLTVNGATDGDYIEDIMIEIDRETGEIVKSIDLKDILPSEFYENYDSTNRDDGVIDWFHQNAVVYDEGDDSIIISSRNQDLVMKLDYETTDIIWIMADEEGWQGEYQNYLLMPTDDGVKFSAGQHAPIILPDQDNNENTIDILLYDNNTVVTRGDEDQSKDFSRAVQYRINEMEKTVEEVWSFGEEFGKAYFTNIIGSARYMSKTGNRLIDFGHMNEGLKSSIFEVDEAGNTLMEAYVTDFPEGAWGYRAERYSLYNDKWEYEIGK
ncbi:aryl-sulfate sulfotransferase [Virgibacillus ndiopensis]|uniref:aryl-sulfate sulfotransferase n=1 Tax=Virgibacillus ndiopensis TaxID=2004408 RepID=UPI001FE584BC|nr:aryl-sulfate sulfotransferase [Virgibacillus ndiopensis]